MPMPAHDSNDNANNPDEPVLRATGLVKQFAGRRVVDGGAFQFYQGH